MIECLPVISKKDFDIAVQNIKELVHILRPDIDFDSCFSIHPYYNSAEMVRLMEKKKQLFENDFFETEEDMAFAVNDAILNGDIETELPIIDGIEIRANNPWNRKLEELLERVSNNMFESIDFDF